MWLRFFLSLVLLFQSVWPDTEIEYGGIAFECDADICGWPEKDYVAKEVAIACRKTARDVCFEAGFLCDTEQKWHKFAPYYDGWDCFDFPFIEIRRYDWERVGVKDVSGEQWRDELFSPEDDYFSDEQYPINQQGVIQAFNRMRKDLSFYADLRLQVIQNKIALRNERISRYEGYLARGYTHITYEEGRRTNPVREDQFSKEDWEDGYFLGLSSEISNEERQIKTLSDKANEVSGSLRYNLDKLEENYEKIDPLLQEIFLWCLQHHQPEGIAFNAAVESLLAGDLPEALTYIRNLIAIAEKANFSAEEMSKIYLLKGRLESEFCLHGEAIVSLTEAIAKDPSSQDAYIERAVAYFESGNYDEAIADYLMQERFMSPSISDKSEFAQGFVLGVVSGFGETACHFIPNTLSSLRGMGHFLWATLQHPIDTPRAMMIHVMEVFSLLRNCSPYELASLAIPELDHLVQEWNQVSDFVRGQQIGHILGKYGTEMLTPLALHKGTAFITCLRDLKKAERLATLKSLSDAEKKGAILGGSTQVVQNRQTQLAKLKIEWDKQNKHVPGKKNFEEGKKSIFTHPDAQSLLDQFAGKGQRRGPIEKGPGYKEKVDFGVKIGQVKKDGKLVDTSCGMIHYSKTGAHIVPAVPDTL